MHFAREHFQSRVANILHQDQSTHSKVDKNVAFYGCNGTSPLYTALGHELLCRLFHHQCRQWGIQAAMLYVVISIELNQIVFSLISSIQNPHKVDTKTPIRFCAAIAIIYVFTFNSMIIIKCTVLIGVATMPILFPLTNDMKYSLNTIKSSLKDKTKRFKTFKQLSQFIQFHSDTKQLSTQSVTRPQSTHPFSFLFWTDLPTIYRSSWKWFWWRYAPCKSYSYAANCCWSNLKW